MPPYSACLIDVFDTAVQVDYTAHALGLSDATGIPVEDLGRAFAEFSAQVTDGRLSIAEGFAEVLARAGADASEDVVAGLVARDSELLRRHTVVPDDTVPFLELLRERGVRTALVSNCADNARPLLDELGIGALVDEMVMSCEVRSAKPAAEMYETALARLGVDAGSALFVDDQPAFCEAADALGVRAVRISRREPGDDGTIASLAELADWF